VTIDCEQYPLVDSDIQELKEYFADFFDTKAEYIKAETKPYRG
jgi:hypothetical protein